MTRARWDRLIAYGSRVGWTDPDAMLEIRGMIGYGLPYTGYVGIPGPVLTTTVPDGVALVLSQGDDSMRFENCVLFFVYVEMLGVGILMVVSWSFTGDTSVLVLPAQEVRMVYDPPVNGLFYGLE
jgi:hypothetical protein